jgi:shikimate dehydrogenase
MGYRDAGQKERLMDHYGLIGNPVSHSLSEKYFTDKFSLEGIPARYERFLLNDINGLHSLLDAYPTLRGLNVTSPFKSVVTGFCHWLDPLAAELKAVNTIRITRQGGKAILEGFNTDVDGFASALLPLIGSKRPATLVLGSGGAARAAAYALKRMDIDFQVVSRSPGKGKVMYDQVDRKLIRNHELIINATPLGTGRHTGLHPDIPYQYLTPAHILFDLNYNPQETPFLKKGKRQKARTENGLLMLQAQAEKAWRIWKV